MFSKKSAAFNMDKLLIKISYLYLGLPLIIFLLGWFKLQYSIPLAAIVISGIIFAFKQYSEIQNNFLNKKIDIKKAILVSVFLFIWVYLSGIGGYGLQNYDYDKHNAIFRDLINYHWPVIYDLPKYSGLLIYYIGYYLPSALIGKLFGWNVANISLFVWSFIGVLISYFWVIKLTRVNSIRTGLLFIFFSGVDLIGYMLNNWQFPLGTQHIDNWFRLASYQSNTTLLFWVPQHAIVAWICASLLLNDKFEDTGANIIFILSLSLIWSPFVFIGLLPLALSGKFNNKRKLISIQNAFISPIIIVFLTGFYTSNHSNVSVRGFISNFINMYEKWPIILAFYILEFGIYIILMKDYIKKLDIISKRALYASTIFLMILPVYLVGINNDLAMRASIPSLFIIMIFIVRFINEHNHYRIEYNIMITLLFLGSITGACEISRSLKYYGNSESMYDNWITLASTSGDVEKQYVETNVNNNFYYNHLLKTHKAESKGEKVYTLNNLNWSIWNEESQSNTYYDIQHYTIKSNSPVDVALMSKIKLDRGTYIVYANVTGEVNRFDDTGAHLSLHGLRKIIDISPGKYEDFEIKSILKIDSDGYDGYLDFGLGGWGKSSGSIKLNDLVISKLE